MSQQIFVGGLPHRVSLYVPTTVNVSEALDSAAAKSFRESALRFLAGEFGGATALQALGAWVAKDGTLVTEEVTIVYAFSSTLTRVQLRTVKRFALDLKKALQQEAVAVEIDGKLFFV